MSRVGQVVPAFRDHICRRDAFIYQFEDLGRRAIDRPGKLIDVPALLHDWKMSVAGMKRNIGRS